MDFGSTFPSQIKSNSNDVDFWFADKFMSSRIPCLIFGK